MSGLDCSCGQRIFRGEIPDLDEWHFIFDEDSDFVSEQVDTECACQPVQGFLKCPACGRPWVCLPPSKVALDT